MLFRSTGYQDGVYYSSSSLNADANYTSTGLIEMTADSSGGTVPLYLKGCTIAAESHCRMTLFDSSKTKKTQINSFLSSTTLATVTELDTNYYQIQLVDMDNYNLAGSSFYVSFSVKGSGANLIVTAGEEIE